MRSASSRTRSRIGRDTSRSYTTTSACCMRRSARKVSRSGSPGPAPTSDTSPPVKARRVSSSAACSAAARLGVAAAEHQLGDRALQHALPEAPPLRRLEARLDPVAERPRQRREAPVARRDQALQARAQQPRQHRRGAAARHRDDERRALDDGGQDERAQRGLVDHVHRDAPRPGGGGDRAVHGIVAGGGDRQREALQVLVAEARRAVRDAARGEVGVEAPRRAPARAP